MLAASRLVGGTAEEWSTGTVLGIAGVILAVQWVWSALWLRRFRQGPVEHAWRLVTLAEKGTPGIEAGGPRVP